MIRPITAEWPARHSVFFLLCLLSGLSYGGAGGQSNNSQVTLHAWLESSNYSQAVPITANFDQWQTDNFAQGERIYSKQLAYAGAAIGNTRFDFHSRLHYYLDFLTIPLCGTTSKKMTKGVWQPLNAL
ncbi:MAG: hypothetical protein KTR17_08235 [Cellvibrionaceae bacterium]|nr:hypothetical protein [Cellvibrionaceae bacterium]